MEYNVNVAEIEMHKFDWEIPVRYDVRRGNRGHVVLIVVKKRIIFPIICAGDRILHERAFQPLFDAEVAPGPSWATITFLAPFTGWFTLDCLGSCRKWEDRTYRQASQAESGLILSYFNGGFGIICDCRRLTVQVDVWLSGKRVCGGLHANKTHQLLHYTISMTITSSSLREQYIWAYSTWCSIAVPWTPHTSTDILTLGLIRNLHHIMQILIYCVDRIGVKFVISMVSRPRRFWEDEMHSDVSGHFQNLRLSKQ